MITKPWNKVIFLAINTSEAEKKRLMSEGDVPTELEEERERAHFDLEQSNSLEVNQSAGHLTSASPQRRSTSPLARYSPGITRNSFGKLGRTLRLVVI